MTKDLLLRVLIFLIFFLFNPGSAMRSQPQAYKLILGLDGVGFEIMQELYDGGYFRSFYRPIPLLATFPSISDPNWSLIMGSEKEESYTKSYFSMNKNSDGSIGSEVGTVINHLTTPPQYEKSFDFKPVGMFQHLMTVTWSKTSALYWIDSIHKILMESENLKKNPYSALIINTDIISHVSGKTSLMDYLKIVDQKLKDLRKNFKDEHHQDLEIILVSDHGAFYTRPKSILFQKELKERGWNWEKKLSLKKDYGFVAPEIISFAAFYTLQNQSCSFAQDLSLVEGIHVSMCTPKKNNILFYSKNGTTELQVFPDKKILKYKILKGSDPFSHATDLINKEISWEYYFNKTYKNKYPNALIRAWEGFFNIVKNPASVLASPLKGYVFTNLTLEILTSLSGVNSTHGSFEKEESFGMVTSTSKIDTDIFTPQEIHNYLFNSSHTTNNTIKK